MGLEMENRTVTVDGAEIEVEVCECSVCNGTGQVSDGWESWKCSHCDGVGESFWNGYTQIVADRDY